MRKDQRRFQFWLNEKDAEHFTRAVTRTGLTQKEYFRQLINGYVPKDLPPPDFRMVLGELYKITEAYRLLATVAVAKGIDAEEIRKQYRSLGKAIEKITCQIYDPLPIEKGEE